MAECAVAVDLNSCVGVVGTIENAIRQLAKPRSWRPSEYAMTKAKAQEVAAQIAEQLTAGQTVILDLFDWHIIQGELARFAKRRPHDQAALGLFVTIMAGIKANPDAVRRQSRADELHRAEQRKQKAEAKIERLTQQMHQEELNAQTARRLAALPCGGCRQPTCGHCCWELGLKPSDEAEPV